MKADTIILVVEERKCEFCLTKNKYRRQSADLVNTGSASLSEHK